MNLSSDTVVKVNLATLASVLLFLGSASWVAFGKSEQIDTNTQGVMQNTEGIDEIVRSLEISRVSDDISDMKTQRRELRMQQRQYPDDLDIPADIDMLEDELEDAILVKECLLEPDKTNCEQ